MKKSQVLNNSEILFRHVQLFCDSTKMEMETLSMVWRFQIINPITRRTILLAHKAKGWGGFCWGRFRADGGNSEEENKRGIEQKQFYNLLATDNGKAVVWMLSNYRDNFKKKIDEVYTFPPCSVPGLREFHMVFKLVDIESGS